MKHGAPRSPHARRSLCSRTPALDGDLSGRARPQPAEKPRPQRHIKAQVPLAENRTVISKRKACHLNSMEFSTLRLRAQTNSRKKSSPPTRPPATTRRGRSLVGREKADCDRQRDGSRTAERALVQRGSGTTIQSIPHAHVSESCNAVQLIRAETRSGLRGSIQTTLYILKTKGTHGEQLVEEGGHSSASVCSFCTALLFLSGSEETNAAPPSRRNCDWAHILITSARNCSSNQLTSAPRKWYFQVRFVWWPLDSERLDRLFVRERKHLLNGDEGTCAFCCTTPKWGHSQFIPFWMFLLQVPDSSRPRSSAHRRQRATYG